MDSTNSTENRKTQFLEAYRSSGCNISIVCRNIKLDRKTFYNWYANDETFKADCNLCRDSLIGVAESALLSHITEGNLKAIIFFFKTKGKHRGYSEKYTSDSVTEEKKTLIQFEVFKKKPKSTT